MAGRSGLAVRPLEALETKSMGSNPDLGEVVNRVGFFYPSIFFFSSFPTVCPLSPTMADCHVNFCVLQLVTEEVKER